MFAADTVMTSFWWHTVPSSCRSDGETSNNCKQSCNELPKKKAV